MIIFCVQCQRKSDFSLFGQLSASFEFLTLLCMLWLQEGVKQFSTTVNKNIPWRKILELGRHVFDQTRTPTDLKDKWKQICSKYGGRV